MVLLRRSGTAAVTCCSRASKDARSRPPCPSEQVPAHRHPQRDTLYPPAAEDGSSSTPNPFPSPPPAPALQLLSYQDGVLVSSTSPPTGAWNADVCPAGASSLPKRPPRHPGDGRQGVTLRQDALSGCLAEQWVTSPGRGGDEPAAPPDPRLARAAGAQENRSSPAARSAGV